MMVIIEELANGYIRTEITDTRIIRTMYLDGVSTETVTLL